METLFSEIDNNKVVMDNGIALKSIKSRFRVQSPLMMKSTKGVYLNIFEAAVVNYPVMHLDVDTSDFTLVSNLTPKQLVIRRILEHLQ